MGKVPVEKMGTLCPTIMEVDRSPKGKQSSKTLLSASSMLGGRVPTVAGHAAVRSAQALTARQRSLLASGLSGPSVTRNGENPRGRANGWPVAVAVCCWEYTLQHKAAYIYIYYTYKQTHIQLYIYIC